VSPDISFLELLRPATYRHRRVRGSPPHVSVCATIVSRGVTDWDGRGIGGRCHGTSTISSLSRSHTSSQSYAPSQLSIRKPTIMARCGVSHPPCPISENTLTSEGQRQAYWVEVAVMDYIELVIFRENARSLVWWPKVRTASTLIEKE